ncbi:hypothetical protein CAI21_16395 [Alkalilimnicola ehrlichii]|uniref:Methyltransferase type 11 domain-containing protein n=1 Tax=Alkalilimnicola ehrlichii TaxID=351052 RepID=A0A3E0WLB8_9GAMM|nr:class I SAM-dependent methyltransferase [Alkalilimnicola ehrlichii]RFA26618.1 hypothetical protein CAI21_16395 [Alkalilimnicola ehrlichii]RFA32951.1 hypothetical protein CAL65_18600 [Alkalilimnicola ehrlichii]
MSSHSQIEQHYGQDDLKQKLLNALQEAGKNPEALSRDDIAGFEEFHIRGRQATRELATAMELGAGMRVLDVGCGIGGPARTLASEFDCEVTGLDLVDAYIEAATDLSQRVGLADKLSFRQGDAAALPFDDAAFDAALLEHVSMNIADKAGLFAGLKRVLRPEGKLGLYEICAGEQPSPHYPVPWAGDETIDFLSPATELQAAAEQAGFTVLAWRDISEVALAWLRNMQEARADRPQTSPLSLNLLMGEAGEEKTNNILRNLEEGRIGIVQAVLQA